MRQKLTSFLKRFSKFALLCFVLFAGLNIGISFYARKYIYDKIENVPAAYCGILLGAGVRNERVTPVLQDRLEAALSLYKAGKIQRFLLTGDHSRKNYDEVNTMKDYLTKKGVNDSVIFLDHAGFDTYNSMYRAKNIFQVKDAIVITQDFHQNRSVFLARNMGLTATGFIADRRVYRGRLYLAVRESFAVAKAFLNLLFQSNPVYKGEVIPITGDSKATFDKD